MRVTAPWTCTEAGGVPGAGYALIAMTDPILIRAAVIGDVIAMASIRARESQTEAFWQDRIGGYVGGTYSPQQALPARTCWVAVQTDQVVGFVAGHRTRRFECDGELQWINIAEDLRGEGIADRLMVAMLAWFHQHNMNRICVNVTAENTAARRLYARHGAVPLRAGWMEWRDLRQSSLAAGAADES